MGYAVNTENFSLAEYMKVTAEYASTTTRFSGLTEWILVFLLGSITIFGFLGNIIIVFIIIRKTKLKCSRNWYVLNLAISDILTSALCIPFTAVRLLMTNWNLGDILCKLVPSLQALYVFVSTFTIVAIAADRYKAIVSCTRKTSKNSNLIYVFPMLWMTSLAMALPMFVYHTVDEVKLTPDVILYKMCMEKWPSFGTRLAYTMIVFISHFIMPLTTVAVLHMLICRFIKMRIGIRNNSTDASRSRRHVARQKKNIILLTGISVSFAFTWLPWTLINLMADLDYRIFMHVDFHLLYSLCQIIAMSSVCINPVVYGWFNSNFRREIQLLFCKKERLKPLNEQITMTEAKSSNRLHNRIDVTLYSYLPTKTDINTACPSTLLDL